MQQKSANNEKITLNDWFKKKKKIRINRGYLH